MSLSPLESNTRPIVARLFTAKFCLILTSHQLSHLYGCCTTYRLVQNLGRVLYIYSGHRYGACVPKAVYCFGFVSGGCVDDTAVAFQRYEDSNVNYSHRWDRGIYFISGTASTKFKFESSLKAATTVRTRVSPIISAHSLCLTPFFSNTSTRRVCEVVCSTYESLPPVIKQSTYRRMALISDTLLVR